MAKLKLSVLDVLVTDVAVIVGEAFAPVGAVAGGVYKAAKLGASEGASVPQAGAQFEPPAVKAQVTPAPALS